MPVAKSSFTATEIKAGIMVLASLAVLILFLVVVQGLRPPEETKTFYVAFTDTGGLNRGADIRFGGAKVGRVTQIELDPADKSKIRVTAQVRPEVPVNEKSQSFIGQTTLTAEKHLEITTGENTAPLLAEGASIPSRSGGLFDQAGALARSVESALEDVRDLLGVRQAKEKEKAGEGNMVTVTSLFQGVDTTIKNGSTLVGDIKNTVAESRMDVDNILKKVQEVEDGARDLVADIRDVVADNRPHVDGAMAGVRDIVDKVQPAVERVTALTERLDAIADALQEGLDSASAVAGEAQGALSDNRPVIDDIVLDLRETVRYLKTFSRTLSEQPEAVIRGKNVEGRR